ncbi:alcohol-forming fatty acyl-CoA reductase [Ranunculus cassubicifolius]
MGAKNVLDFAKKCVKLEMLLHVSTAYVCGERTGVIIDNPFKMGETLNGNLGLDVEQEHKIIQQKMLELQARHATKQEETIAMRELGMQRSRFYGWPNTYVFTKSMGEMVIGHERGNIPLCIMQPTIIIGTYKEPFSGWMEGFRTVDGFVIGYGKGKLTSLFLESDVILDLIPADMVVNAMIVAMVNHANQPNEFIYQVGSSMRNPFIVCVLRDYAYHYFYENPWINSSGNPVRVRKATLFNTAASFHRHIFMRYLLPLKVLQVLNGALCNKLHRTYTNINRKVKFMLRIMELNRPYLLFKGIFDTTKIEGLRGTLTNESELKTYYFDPSIIDWEFYFMNIYFPSIVKYVF